MLALFILVLALCFGVCQWATGRAALVKSQGLKERAPTAHTASEIARLYLAFEGAQDVEVVEYSGVVTDYFDPARRKLFLHPRIARSTSLGAWAVALHEAGHALQTQSALSDLKWRQTVIRLNRYGPFFALLAAGGLLFLRLPPRISVLAVAASCLIFLLLNLGTLAVEYNANARVRRFLEKHLYRHPEALDQLSDYLSRMAVREVGDILNSPRYFFLSALPGSGRVRPTVSDRKEED